MRSTYSSIITAGKRFLALLVVVSAIGSSTAYAAVGCTLNDPDRDIKQLFPESTGYKTNFLSIKEAGGEVLFNKIQQELGDKFDSIYEAIDVPYSFYDVLKGKEVIAHIHGVNQKGTYGGMQLILATDLNGKIINFYYQKMSSPEAAKFMHKNFTNQFIGLALDDFMKGNPAINDPSTKSHEDYLAALRGIKKNLILLKEFRLSQTKQEQ